MGDPGTVAAVAIIAVVILILVIAIGGIKIVPQAKA